MKIIVETPKEVENSYGDERDGITIKIDGARVFSIWEGEPEDMRMYRDLSDALSVPSLLKYAYEAGKRGEEFIIEEVEIDDLKSQVRQLEIVTRLKRCNI